MKRPTWKAEKDAAEMQLPEGFRVVVHHYLGCGNEWFLTIHRGVVDRRPLKSKSLDEAKQEAMAIAHELFKNVLDALEA